MTDAIIDLITVGIIVIGGSIAAIMVGK